MESGSEPVGIGIRIGVGVGVGIRDVSMSDVP